jgi:2-C-methyl-D-erythritol 4-phosphate cytidylyltransferase
MKTVTIIPAGGRGLRFSCEGMKKQYLKVWGIPILIHTLRPFDLLPLIDHIILVVPPEDMAGVSDLLAEHKVKKVKYLVPGGAHRQESVWSGIKVLEEDVDIVVVHDAVRPLIEASLIEATITRAKEEGAAIVAVPAIDTVKLCDQEMTVVRTLSREEIYLAQTPQAFRRDLIVSAYEAAFRGGYYGTDDASLVERLVPGARTNIKVTTPEDLKWCEILMRRA